MVECISFQSCVQICVCYERSIHSLCDYKQLYVYFLYLAY